MSANPLLYEWVIFLFLHENKKKCTQSGNFRFDINPAHFKILSSRELKHGNVCKIILKTLFQKYGLELTQCIQIYVDHYPGPRGFSWFFFAKEIKSKPRRGDTKSRKRRGEREKPHFPDWRCWTLMSKRSIKKLYFLMNTSLSPI